MNEKMQSEQTDNYVFIKYFYNVVSLPVLKYKYHTESDIAKSHRNFFSIIFTLFYYYGKANRFVAVFCNLI